jgi:hypothetical protein
VSGDASLISQALLGEEGGRCMLIALKDRIWGDLKDQDAVLMHYHSIRSPIRDSIQMDLVFSVKGRARLWQGRQIWVVPKQVGLTHSLSMQELYRLNSPQELINHLMSHLAEKSIREVGPRLREADPRIGARVFVGQVEQPAFLRCPILDPPVFLFPEIQGETPYTRCLLCQERFRLYQDVYWGGGTLLWVCDSCAHGDTRVDVLSSH